MKQLPFVSLLLAAGCGAHDSRSTAPPPVASGSEVRDPSLAPAISEIVDPGARKREPVREAVAVLRPTRGSDVTGVVRFVEATGGGLDVFAVAHGITDDTPHAYHVHVYGDCSAPDATSAGPHFHFTGSSFDKEVGYITGNLGHLQKHATGPTSSHRARIENASLHGNFSIIGRAVVIHEHGNDPEVTPDGGAGARIACGVIGVANPQPPRSAGR